MKNTLVDLNNHLFEQIERLNDEELQGEKLEKEIARSKAIAGIADKIIENANLGLSAAKLRIEHSKSAAFIPEMLENKKSD